MIVRASSTVSGGRGPLQLPRVRPVGARMIDEAWVAWVDQGTMIQPTVARGLAWLDPREVPGLAGPPVAGSDLREALAWRWIAPRADARVDRERIEQEPGASIRLHAKIDPTGRRLVIDGRILVYAGAGPLRFGSALDRPGRRLARAVALHRRGRGAARERADRRTRPLPARFSQGRFGSPPRREDSRSNGEKPFDSMRNTPGSSMA